MWLSHWPNKASVQIQKFGSKVFTLDHYEMLHYGGGEMLARPLRALVQSKGLEFLNNKPGVHKNLHLHMQGS